MRRAALLAVSTFAALALAPTAFAGPCGLGQEERETLIVAAIDDFGVAFRGPPHQRRGLLKRFRGVDIDAAGEQQAHRGNAPRP